MFAVEQRKKMSTTSTIPLHFLHAEVQLKVSRTSNGNYSKNKNSNLHHDESITTIQIWMIVRIKRIEIQKSPLLILMTT